MVQDAVKRPRILVVEDEDLQYEIYEEALAEFELVRVGNISEALVVLARKVPDLMILDHVLDDGETGLGFLEDFKEALPHVPVVVVSGMLEVQQRMDALQGPRRAHYCLTKPVDLDKLLQVVRIALAECSETEVLRQFESLEKSRRVDIEFLLSRSTDRLNRQILIRRRLESAKGRPNISALAREYRVSRRTIIRDLQEMIRRGQLDSSVYPAKEMEGIADAD